MDAKNDSASDCPLCMEQLELDDIKFFPCSCGYQICRFCWHRIRTDENGLCPACRKPYEENPANFTPLTPTKMKAQKTPKKPKNTIDRKQLADVHVVQRNLLFVTGLTGKLTDVKLLRSKEYFGMFGQLLKVSVNNTPNPFAHKGQTAYITYAQAADALKAIKHFNDTIENGTRLKVTLGTNKYCELFVNYQACNKQNCTFLHELAKPEDTFTREEIRQGKCKQYLERLLNGPPANSDSISINKLKSSNGLGKNKNGNVAVRSPKK